MNIYLTDWLTWPQKVTLRAQQVNNTKHLLCTFQAKEPVPMVSSSQRQHALKINPHSAWYASQWFLDLSSGVGGIHCIQDN